MTDSPTTRLRRFNRAVTAEVGALDASYLGRGRPLGPARVLTSLATNGTEVAELRARLGLDSGLTSRILRGLEGEGLIETQADPDDGRRRIARPTPAGLAEIAAYEALSEKRASAMLAALPKVREDLLAAMDRIAVVLNRDRIAIRPVDPAGPEARACLTAYYAELSHRFGEDFGPDTGKDADEFLPPAGRFLIADSDGCAIGCVALRREGEGTGEVKRLWIAPEARGLGLSHRLMGAVEGAARDVGYARLCLDTSDKLPEAVALYRGAGWREIAAYNDNPHARHWFEKTLTR